MQVHVWVCVARCHLGQARADACAKEAGGGDSTVVLVAGWGTAVLHPATRAGFAGENRSPCPLGLRYSHSRRLCWLTNVVDDNPATQVQQRETPQIRGVQSEFWGHMGDENTGLTVHLCIKAHHGAPSP